jgi:hypothetical protein
MRKAGNDAEGNEIGTHRLNDRNCRCRALGGKNSVCVRHDDINVQTHQFDRATEEPVLICVRIAEFDVEVPAFDVAKITKLRQKYVGGRYILGGGTDTKSPDPGQPLRLLRPCRERPRRRAAQ